MIKIINYTEFDNRNINSQNEKNHREVEEIVLEILNDIEINGDNAIIKYNSKFDNNSSIELELSKSEIEEAFDIVDSEFIEILKEVSENIRKYHESQKKSGYLLLDSPGIMLGQKITPIDRVGIYVPGGTAVYPSSVLMNTIPAKIAGVNEIIMVTPADENGKINPDVIVAGEIAGVDRIFKVGGAQAIGALAYGTETIPKVDKIVGPGNIFVATAKKLVFGKVDIDMVAGPSEILIIADNTANPRYIAIDLLSQAEHDENARVFLITDSIKLGEEVGKHIEIELEKLIRSDIAKKSIKNNGLIIVVDNLNTGADISNDIAPEHLIINTKEPLSLLANIKHAGSIFLGEYSPEALGDYFAGPNHILPTNGTAKYSSGLSVDDFIKKSSIIYYDKDALNNVGNKIAKFAMREGLEAHGKSVTIRMNGDDVNEFIR